MNFKNKRFLVIGGAGFMGSHVVDELAKTAAKEIIGGGGVWGKRYVYQLVLEV
jgi:nucleoside-diphosphate-sugar epimerase